MMSRSAPPIVEGVPEGKIGAVISGDYLHPDMKAIYLARLLGKTLAAVSPAGRWAEQQRASYREAGLPYALPDVVQTGVLVLDRETLQAVYDDASVGELKWYEQLPLSYAILGKGLLHRIDSSFNLVLYERMVLRYRYLMKENLPDRDFLVHLAG